ncbi:MAG: hypothetical protein ACI3YT_10465 [Prevotella sp.]
MRKIYNLFLAMLLGMIGMAANAQTAKVTVIVDEASRVGVQVYNSNTYSMEEQAVVTGSNSYTVNQYAQVKIYAKPGSLLESVVNEGSNQLNGYKTEYSTYPYSDMTLDVKTVSEDVVYTASFNLNIDNPSSVRAMFDGSYRDITLYAGDNTIKYDPNNETRIMISPAGGAPLYKVSNNGEAVAPQGTTYYVNTEGANVKVESIWPADVKFTLAFDFADEESKGFVSGVAVNGVPVPDYADGVEIQGGAQVSVISNTTDYSLDQFSVNGSTTSFGYGQYNFYITENTTLGVKAHKLGSINFTLNADDPSNFTVYNGYEYNNNSMAIVAGDNALSVSQGGNKCITIVAKEGCKLVSVNDGTQELGIYGGSCQVNVSEGMVITVKSVKIVRDKKANVTVYGRSNANQYFSFASQSDRTLTFDFKEGENEMNFCDADLPFGFSCYGDAIGTDNKVYINGCLAQLNGYNYELTFDNGAAIDIVLDGSFDVNEKKVTFVLGEGISPDQATVTFPAGVAYKWATDGLVSVLDESYEVTVTPAVANAIAVIVDGADVAANVEGVFVFKVTPASIVNIVDPTATGINGVNAMNGGNEIYTLQGVKVGGKLSKGMYVINGKKVIVSE